jgi:hypothetical protein
VCIRSAHCEGINGRQPHNLSKYLLLAAPTRSAYGRAGATGSIWHKRVRCYSDIDQFEKDLTDPQKFATSVDLSATIISSHEPRGKMIPHQRDPITLAARFIAPPMTTLAAADPTVAARATTSILYRVPIETARLRQDVDFRVGARLGKIKRKELNNASESVSKNVLKFIRTFEQYIKEIRPDSTKEEVIELSREFFFDTMNLLHRQILQISALHIFLREVLFAYDAVEKPVGGGYIPPRLIKVLVPDKEE